MPECRWNCRRRMLTVWVSTTLNMILTSITSQLQLTSVTIFLITMMTAPEHILAYTECQAHHECKKHEYCYTATNNGYCVDCIDCGFYKRTSSGVKACAHNALQCGDCINGFHEELFTDGKRLYCVTNTTLLAMTTASPIGIKTNMVYLITGIAVVLIIVVLVLVGRMWLQRKKTPTLDVHMENPDGNHQPPAYSEGGTELPLLPVSQQLGHESSVAVNISYAEEKNEQALTQAVPYKRAQYPYHTYSYNSDDEESSPPGLSDNPSPNPPDLNEEETIASPWAPGTNYGQVNVNIMDNAINAENDTGSITSSDHPTSSGTQADPMGPTAQGTVGIFSAFHAVTGNTAAVDVLITNDTNPNDSGLSMQSSAATSNTSLANPLGPTGQGTVPIYSNFHALNGNATEVEMPNSDNEEDFDDSGLSRPPSHGTSANSLADPMEPAGQGTIPIYSSSFTAIARFTAGVARSNDESSTARYVPYNGRRQQSVDYMVPMKRLRRNSSSVWGTGEDSDDES